MRSVSASSHSCFSDLSLRVWVAPPRPPRIPEAQGPGVSDALAIVSGSLCDRRSVLYPLWAGFLSSHTMQSPAEESPTQPPSSRLIC